MMMLTLGALTLLSLAALFVVGLDSMIWLYFIGIAQLFMISMTLAHPAMKRTQRAIFMYCLLLCAISLVSYHESVTLGFKMAPYLGGSDGERYFLQILELSDGNILENLLDIRSNYFGFQVIQAFAFKALEQNLIVGLMLNNTVLLLILIVLAKTTLLITRDPGVTFYAALAFMLTAKFIFYANSLLKEPFLCLGVALVAYSFALLKIKRHTSLLAYAGLAGAVLIFGTMRVPMLILLPLAGFFILGRDMLRRGWLIIAIGVLGAGVLVTVFSSFTSREFTGAYIESTATGNTILSKSLASGVDAGGVVGRVMSGYTQQSLPVRIALVPIPTIIQYVLPFDFWSTKFLDDHIINLFNTNLNIIWYLFIGVFMLFTILNWHRLPNPVLQSMFLVGGTMYLLIAFVFGGVVPRYASPYLIFMFPTIGFWMNEWRVNGRFRVRLRSFFRLYYLGFLLAGLVYLMLAIIRS